MPENKSRPTARAASNTSTASITVLADIVHQCSACGARACVVAPADAEAMPYNSRDLMGAYLRGAHDERARIAGADHEHGQALLPIGERSSRLRKQETLHLFRRCAEAFHREHLGRPYREHRGGPVDWTSGRPLRRLAVVA